MKVLIFELQIFGHRVPVFYCPDLGDWGEFNEETLEILLNPKLAKQPSRFWEILIHECCHAVSYLNELGLREKQVTQLGRGLQQMLSPLFRREAPTLPSCPLQDDGGKGPPSGASGT